MKNFKTRVWVFSPYLTLVFILISINELSIRELGYSASLNQLITHSRQLIGDTPYYTPIPKITDAKIINYLNEGQHYASAHAWAFIKRTSFTLVSRTTEYALPNDFLTSMRVTFNDLVLPESTLNSLDFSGGDSGSNWVIQSGKPSSYYIRTSTFSYIGFNPIPTQISTGIIILDYYSQVADMVKLTDIPFNGLREFYPLHETLPKFVGYRFFVSVGNFTASEIYAKEFITDITRLKEIPAIKPNYRPGLRPTPR